MSAIDRASLMRRTLPLTAVADPDGKSSYATQGADLIRQIGGQVERRQATASAFAAARSGTKVGLSAVAEEGAARIGVAAATRGAARLGTLAIPVAGEVAGAAMLAYDAWKLGYRAVTGQSFEQTSVGREVTKVENGMWRMGAGAAGGMLDALGLKQAAALTRGPLLEMIVGEPSEPATQHSSAAPKAVASAGTRTDTPTMLTPGPARALSDADWREPPYRREGNRAAISTTPLGRSFGIMDMLVDDFGIPRANRIAGPQQAVQPAVTPQAARARAARPGAGGGIE